VLKLSVRLESRPVDNNVPPPPKDGTPEGLPPQNKDATPPSSKDNNALPPPKDGMPVGPLPRTKTMVRHLLPRTTTRHPHQKMARLRLSLPRHHCLPTRPSLQTHHSLPTTTPMCHSFPTCPTTKRRQNWVHARAKAHAPAKPQNI
jgi:hypothetical protein